MNREGSNADVESLKDLFTDLGFDITICHNKSRDEIEDIIDKFAKEDHSDADCLVVVVLSHGKGKPYIWARDDFYSVESVWTPFTADKCPTLAGKPKIFIFQACRGNDLDPGVNLSRKHQTETVLSTESHRTPTDAGLPLDLPSVDCFDTAENPSRKRSQSEMNSCSEPYKIPAYADFIFAFCSVEEHKQKCPKKLQHGV
ncbi:caspase-1-like [Anabrus simplex]|uniref:caspase-1-like n=1 Tax=Anabrus simplex TaxID=316456 RepID=UPI0035A2987F